MLLIRKLTNYLVIMGFLFGFASIANSLNKTDLYGVWELKRFYIEDGDQQDDWCHGAKGSIAYLPGGMFVGINCDSFDAGSGAEKLDGKLFYSGPFEVDARKNEVIHRVKNYSHPSLENVFHREVSFPKKDHLKLSGKMGDGKSVIVEWRKVESFSYSSEKIAGVWELVGSENTVPGSDRTIPFCNGYHGTIMFTPGGYSAVAINCGENDGMKKQPADEFDRKFFYFGKYSQMHQVDMLEQNIFLSSVDELINETARRDVEFQKDLLLLSGTSGSEFVATWKRLSSFKGFPQKNQYSFKNLEKIGDANWSLKDNYAKASKGNGFLVVPTKMRSFTLKVDFFPSQGSNSGIFMRCKDKTKIDDKNCYEANIFDSREDQSGATGAIVGVSPPNKKIISEGKWNSYEISLDKDRIFVKINGTQIVGTKSQKHMNPGYIALQYAQGKIRFRNLVIKNLDKK